MGRRGKREALLRMEREMGQAERELADLRQKIAEASNSLMEEKEGYLHGAT